MQGPLVPVGELSEPVQVVRHLDVDARNASLSASHAPADDSDQIPGSGPFADQWTAAVSLWTINYFLKKKNISFSL